MNRFISVVLILIILVACVGFFRGWFSMTTNNEPLTEKLDVHFQVDRDKMKQDANAVEEKTEANWEEVATLVFEFPCFDWAVPKTRARLFETPSLWVSGKTMPLNIHSQKAPLE